MLPGRDTLIYPGCDAERLFRHIGLPPVFYAFSIPHSKHPPRLFYRFSANPGILFSLHIKTYLLAGVLVFIRDVSCPEYFKISGSRFSSDPAYQPSVTLNPGLFHYICQSGILRSRHILAYDLAGIFRKFRHIRQPVFYGTGMLFSSELISCPSLMSNCHYGILYSLHILAY